MPYNMWISSFFFLVNQKNDHCLQHDEYDTIWRLQIVYSAYGTRWLLLNVLPRLSEPNSVLIEKNTRAKCMQIYRMESSIPRTGIGAAHQNNGLCCFFWYAFGSIFHVLSNIYLQECVFYSVVSPSSIASYHRSFISISVSMQSNSQKHIEQGNISYSWHSYNSTRELWIVSE